MSVRRFSITAPFTDGYVSDLPAELLGPRMSSYLQNGIFPRGVLERRRGWEYDGTTADAGSGTSHGVARAVFKRVNTTLAMVQIMASATSNDFYIHNSGAAGTSIWSTLNDSGTNGFVGAQYLPRCLYRGEMIWCCQSGQHALVRYAGAASSTVYTGSGAVASGEARVTGVTALPSGLSAGWLMSMRSVIGGSNYYPPYLWLPVEKAVSGATEVTSTMVRASGALASVPVALNPVGFAAPCVNVYDEGAYTVSVAGVTATATGLGTRWASEGAIFDNSGQLNDAFLAINSSGGGTLTDLTAVASDTSITVASETATAGKYAIMRRMPFKDACVFRQCFFGAGVAQHPSRLYYYPPGAELGLPPNYGDSGAEYDPATNITATVATDLMMRYVEVPSSFDSDPIIALLPTDTSLYVLKRNAVYRVTGDYPKFRSDIVASDAGCLDIRSAISDESGVYWAGKTGVWTIRGGMPYNLAGAEGRPGILHEWRDLTADLEPAFAYNSGGGIAIGVAEGHLIVSVAASVCYVYHLASDRWCGRFTNVVPRQMWSLGVPGETQKCIGVQDADARRVIDYTPMFRSVDAGTLYAPSSAGPAADGDGDKIPLTAYTPSTFALPESVVREHRLVSVKVAAKFEDTATPSSAMSVSVYHSSSSTGAAAEVNLADMTAVATNNGVRTFEWRPGSRGRYQRLSFVMQANQVDADFNHFAIHEITGRVRLFGTER